MNYPFFLHFFVHYRDRVEYIIYKKTFSSFLVNFTFSKIKIWKSFLRNRKDIFFKLPV